MALDFGHPVPTTSFATCLPPHQAAKFRRRRSVIPPPHLCIDTSICPASCLSAGKYWELLSIHVLLQIFMPCDTLSFCAPEAFSAPEAAAFSSVRDFVLGS